MRTTQVDIITSTNGQSVMIDVESGSSMLVVKQQLEQATGVPVQFQKVTFVLATHHNHKVERDIRLHAQQVPVC